MNDISAMYAKQFDLTAQAMREPNPSSVSDTGTLLSPVITTNEEPQ